MSYTLRKGRAATSFLVPFLLFTFLLLLATWKHTFWRDESEVWLVARISTSISSLLHNARYEGHPPLWYLVNYAITRFTWNPEWMKLPNFLFAIASAAMILSADRIRLWVRVGMAFSYFILFEYGIIARNYMIGVVFLIAAAMLMRRSEPKNAAVPILLSLAALTSLPALIISMCLGILYLWLVHRSSRDRTIGGLFIELGAKNLLGIIIFTISALIAAATIRPPADSSLFLESRPPVTSLIAKFGRVGHLISEAYIPLPQWHHAFWTTSLFGALPLHLDAILGTVLLIGVICLLRDPAVRVFFIGATAIELAQLIVSGRATRRHIGWLFIVLLLALLLDRIPFRRNDTPQPIGHAAWRNTLLSVVLLSQVISALFAVAVSLKYPFSTSRQAAGFLRDQHLDHAPLAFEPFYVSESVLAYLQRPSAYSFQQQAEASYVIWDQKEFYSRRAAPTPQEFHAISQNGEAPVLITEKPLTPAEMASLNVKLLASFDNAINTLDSYYIYR